MTTPRLTNNTFTPATACDPDRLGPTARLLWAACRGEIAPDLAGVSRALADGADVDFAVTVACTQRVGPLLWTALDDAGASADLGPAGDALYVDSRIRAVQADVLIPRALALSVEPLRRAGLDAVIFKGPALAARYRAARHRPMDDVDIILAHDEHDRGVAALTSAGWRVADVVHRHGYDTVLQHTEVPGLPLELHRDLASWRNRANALTSDLLWQRRVPLTCFDSRAFGLPAEEELVALAAHAAKPFHCFNRLMWVVDLAVVVQAAGARFDWDRVAAFAAQTRCRTALAIGLRLAMRLGITAPDALMALPGGRVRTASLAPVLDETWPLKTTDYSVRHKLRYGLSDDRIRQAKLLVTEILDQGGRVAPSYAVKLGHRGMRRWLRPGR